MSDEMTSPGALPPMGHYPDPDVPGQLRFWDGARWHASLPQHVTPPLGRSFPIIAWALVALLVTAAAARVADVAVNMWGRGAVADELDLGLLDKARTYDSMEAALSIAHLVILLAAGVTWCVWQHRLASSADDSELRRSPRMHVLGWFIPVVSLWYPPQNVGDLGRSYRVAAFGPLVGAWWTCFVVTTFTDAVAGDSGMKMVGGPEAFRHYATAQIMAASLWAACAVFAVAIVARLSVVALAREAEKTSA